ISNLQKTAGSHLVIVEALPSPADFPVDAAGDRRAFELLIDDRALRAVGGAAAATEQGPKGES
ncbi:MAG: hypothetical protein ACJ759_22840, partial [Thermoanaerobaculia bacterium]